MQVMRRDRRDRDRVSLVKSKQVVAFCVSLDLLLQSGPGSRQASPGFTVGVKLNDLRRDLLVGRETGRNHVKSTRNIFRKEMF